jgi:hypothetical protein
MVVPESVAADNVFVRATFAPTPWLAGSVAERRLPIG